jgi:hypothetical protein
MLLTKSQNELAMLEEEEEEEEEEEDDLKTPSGRDRTI